MTLRMGRVTRWTSPLLAVFTSILLVATPGAAETVDFGGLNAKVLSSSENLTADIVLTLIPLELLGQDEEVTIQWMGDVEAYMRYSRSPGGGDPANYPDSTETKGVGSLTFRPVDEGMGIGLYYCVIVSTDGTRSSIEFQLAVESDVGVTMVAPVGEVTSPAPVFSWQPNPGVPYYHIIVSDQPFEIEKTDGEQRVKGANVIWMAITPESSLGYGEPDPSGSFIGTAPPLVVGNTYNWIVLNNYGNTLATSSEVTSTPKDFWLVRPVELSAPQNIYPARGDSLNYEDDEIITFQWSEVPEAVSYHLFLSEYREVVGGSEGLYPVWDAVTSNTLVDLEARYFLINAKYVWKVTAEDGEGNAATSDTTSFFYDIPVATLDIRTRDSHTGQELPYTSVKISPIDGSVDITPILIDETGHFEKIIPVGTYTITGEKEGYETEVDTVVAVEDPYPESEDERGDVEHIIWLSPSPSRFYGTVVDSSAGNIPVDGATVGLRSSDGATKSAITDANGNFSISVSAGEWEITAGKTGYTSTTLARSIKSGENVNLDTLQIAENKFQIYGVATDPDGNPLWGVEVRVEDTQGTVFTDMTDAEGSYVIKVSPGEWSLTASKLGYVSPRPRRETVLGANVRIDLVLSAMANFIKGKVTDGKSPISDVTVEAAPSVGNPVSTLTNTYGEYTLSLPSGSYVLTARKAGYTSPPGLSVTVGVTVSVGETKAGLDFTLVPDNSVIRGRVTSDGVAGIAEARVEAGGKVTFTDASGYYELKVLSGTHLINVSKSGYLSGDPQKITLGPGETISGIDFLLVPNASVISGTVMSGGSLVFDATVKAEGVATEVTTRTDAMGEFSLSVPPGTYDIIASKTGFVPDTLRSVVVGPGVTLGGRDLHLTEYIGYLRGTITDGVSPLRKVEVTIQGQGDAALTYSTVSDVAGNFIVAVFPELAYQISASKAGYSRGSVETGIVPVGGTEAVSIELDALPAQISGRVVDLKGSPIPVATVKASREGKVTSTLTDARGEYRLSLESGTYTLEAAKPGYISPGPMEQTLLPGQKMRDVDLSLKSNLSAIIGSVVDGVTGLGIAGVRIVATESATETGGTVSTAEDGSFSLLDLLPGTYTLSLTKEGYVARDVQNIALPGGISKMLGDLQLTPKAGSISGRVEGPAGATVMATLISTGETVYGVTDETGSYTIDHLSIGDYELKVVMRGYSSSPDLVSLSLGPGEQPTDIDFVLEKNLGLIGGRVYLASDETIGLKGVMVTADDGLGNVGSAVTDASGRYRIENLADLGQVFALTAELTGYLSSIDTLKVVLGTEDANFPMEPVQRVIKGAVINQKGTTEGLPQSINVKVSSEDIGTRIVTTGEEEGYSFVISGLSPGASYLIGADIMRKGYTAMPKSIMTGDEDTTFTQVIVNVHTASIRGDVGVQGAVITVTGQDPTHTYSVISQPDGSFTVSNMYDDTYRVSASKPKYISKSLDIAVGLGEVKDLGASLKLERVEITLTGSVVDSISGDGLPDVPVVAISADAKSMGSDTTDENGDYRIVGLSPEIDYIVATSLDPEGYENVKARVSVTTVSPDPIILTVGVHTSSISGRVIEGQTGEGIKDAIVRIDGYLTTTTDPDGNYAFLNLYEGDYQITVEKSGYSAVAEHVSLGRDEESVRDFQIKKLEYTISGSVTSGGLKIRNAVVRLTRWDDGSFVAADTTDQAGGFALTGLTPDVQYRLTVSKKGYERYETGAIDISGGSQVLDVVLIPSPNTIYGTVYYESTGQTVAQAVVRATDSSGRAVVDTTDAFGDYALMLPAGLYSLMAQIGALASPTENVVGGAFLLKDLKLVETASVRGTVLYLDTPIANAVVVAQNLESGAPSETRSGSDGAYSLVGLLPGAYRISVTASGFAIEDSPRELSLSFGQAAIVDFHGRGISNTISGIVTDEQGEPVEGATVYIVTDGDTLTTETLANGSFAFEKLVDGIYTLFAEASGYQSKRVGDVSVANNRPVALSFSLTAISGTISGTVTNSKTGTGLEGTVVSLMGPVSLADTTSSDGKYLFAGLNPGQYVIRAVKPSFAAQPDSFDITLPPGVSLKGLDFLLTPEIRLADIEGIVSHGLQGISGAVVIVRSHDLSFTDSTVTDTQGRYQFTGLITPESYRIEVRVKGFPAAFSGLIELTEAGARWNYDFPSGQIKFKLTEDGVTPLEGVNVRVKGEGVDLSLVSDVTGICDTPDNLPAGDYRISILGTGDRIPPRPWVVSLTSAEARTEEIILPLRHVPVVSAAATDSIRILVSSAIADPAIWTSFDLYVKGVGQAIYLARAMKPEETAFVSTIYPQNRSGELGYYVKAQAKLRRFYSKHVTPTDALLTYSGESTPYQVEITSQGILAVAELEPKISVLGLNGEITLEVHGYDEIGSLLDPVISEGRDVVWELVSDDPLNYGARVIPEEDPRRARFSSGEFPGTIQVKVKVGLHNVYAIAVATVDVKQITLEKVKFVGDVKKELDATLTHRFFVSGEGTTPDGQRFDVSIKPTWSVEPAGAGTIVEGTFDPRDSYIGEARIIASVNEIKTEWSVSVYQKLIPTDRDVTFDDGEGFSLTLPGGSVRTTTRAYLSRPGIPPIKRYTPTSEVLGKVYQIRLSVPNPFRDRDFKLKLPLPGGIEPPERLSIRYWDKEELDWVRLETESITSDAGSFIVAKVPGSILGKYAQYAVIMESEPLGIHDLSFSPNPFSPQVGDGLRISYRLSSDNARTPFVTIRIYNMVGVLVKTLIENEAQAKGEQWVTWDGTTDSGREARNGRYIVRIQAEDASGTKEVVKTIVLVK